MNPKINLDIKIPNDFVRAVERLSTELPLMRESISMSVFVSGVAVGFIVASLLYLFFRK